MPPGGGLAVLTTLISSPLFPLFFFRIFLSLWNKSALFDVIFTLKWNFSCIISYPHQELSLTNIEGVTYRVFFCMCACAVSIQSVSLLLNYLFNIHLSLSSRWKKATPAWSSWNGSWRRLRRRPPGPTPPAGNCRGSWTTPPRPVRDSVGRSTRSRTASGRPSLNRVDRKSPSQCRQRGWSGGLVFFDKFGLLATVEQHFSTGGSQTQKWGVELFWLGRCYVGSFF